jgi:TolB-like protein
LEADFLTHDAILSVLRAAQQDAKDGVHLWAERYDRAVDDIFAIQDEITLVLATEMQVKLTEGEQARLRYTLGHAITL